LFKIFGVLDDTFGYGFVLIDIILKGIDGMQQGIKAGIGQRIDQFTG
jgi:hypothetical protein